MCLPKELGLDSHLEKKAGFSVPPQTQILDGARGGTCSMWARQSSEEAPHHLSVVFKLCSMEPRGALPFRQLHGGE